MASNFFVQMSNVSTLCMRTIFSIKVNFVFYLKRLFLCDEVYFRAFHRDCGMIYNAKDALEDWSACITL